MKHVFVFASILIFLFNSVALGEQAQQPQKLETSFFGEIQKEISKFANCDAEPKIYGYQTVPFSEFQRGIYDPTLIFSIQNTQSKLRAFVTFPMPLVKCLISKNQSTFTDGQDSFQELNSRERKILRNFFESLLRSIEKDLKLRRGSLHIDQITIHPSQISKPKGEEEVLCLIYDLRIEKEKWTVEFAYPKSLKWE